MSRPLLLHQRASYMRDKESRSLQRQLLHAIYHEPERVDAVFEQYWKYHYRYFLRRFQGKFDSLSKEDAEDLLQEAFLKLIQNLKARKLRSNGRVNAYFWGILKNTGRHFLTHKTRPYQEDLSKIGEDALEFYLRERKSGQLALIEECLKLLTENCRKILDLFYFREFKYREIATHLGLENERSARTTKYRCMTHLKNHFFQLNQ